MLVQTLIFCPRAATFQRVETPFASTCGGAQVLTRQPAGGLVHSYSRDFNHTAFVHVAIFAIAVLVYWLVISWLPTGIQLSPLTALTIFGLLEIVFEFWAWRFLRFLPFHVVDPTGDYDGTLAAGGSDQYRVRCTIKQTWSRIEIFFDSSGVTSRSFSAALVKDRLQTGQL